MQRYRSSKQCRNYDRTLLAVYLTADDEGLFSTASNGAIAKTAGLAADTVKAYLAEMVREGVVEVYRPGVDGVSCRVMILLDHPTAVSAAQHMRDSTADGRRQ